MKRKKRNEDLRCVSTHERSIKNGPNVADVSLGFYVVVVVVVFTLRLFSFDPILDVFLSESCLPPASSVVCLLVCSLYCSFFVSHALILTTLVALTSLNLTNAVICKRRV